MEQIFHDGTLIGLLLMSFDDGTSPITDAPGALQVLTLKHPKGTVLAAHTHTPTERTTASLQECVVVKSGEITVDLYSPNKILFRKIKLTQGQAFLCLNGGLGIHMDEDSELFEFKNGPFVEDKELI